MKNQFVDAQEHGQDVYSAGKVVTIISYNPTLPAPIQAAIPKGSSRVYKNNQDPYDIESFTEEGKHLYDPSLDLYVKG